MTHDFDCLFSVEETFGSDPIHCADAGSVVAASLIDRGRLLVFPNPVQRFIDALDRNDGQSFNFLFGRI